jgi:hypothetical protein
MKAIAFLLTFSVSGCSVLDPRPECSAVVEVTVSAGIDPTFSWSPACAVNTLTVSSSVAGAVWRITTPGDLADRSISPPVHYGEIPSAARQITPPASLEVGGDYIIWIGTPELSGTPGCSDCGRARETVGTTTFTVTS